METNYKEINYMGKPVTILQYLSESDRQFNEKLKYIQKLEKAGVEWKEANRLSKIWYGIKFLKCRYAPEVFNRVISFEREKNKQEQNQ